MNDEIEKLLFEYMQFTWKNGHSVDNYFTNGLIAALIDVYKKHNWSMERIYKEWPGFESVMVKYEFEKKLKTLLIDK